MSAGSDEIVGRVTELARYPVKSMAGERMAETEIDWQGVKGDRQYAFARRGNTSRFPWMTARDAPHFLLHRATHVDPTNPRSSTVRVTDHESSEWDIRDPKLVEKLARVAGTRLDLLQINTGAYDEMPISLLTTASLARLEDRHGQAVDRRRLRASIVIDSCALDMDWAGRRLRLGEGNGVELLVAYAAPRCSMVTIDPDTMERDPGVMRTIANEFGGKFAMYASVGRPGTLRVGDAARLLPL